MVSYWEYIFIGIVGEFAFLFKKKVGGASWYGNSLSTVGIDAINCLSVLQV